MQEMNIAAKSKLTILENGNIASPKGFSAGGLATGLKQSGKLDLGWIYSEVPAAAAGVYTTNSFQAAPLQVTQESIAKEHVLQGVLVNSGNANACTGQQGLMDAYEMRKAFSDVFALPNHYTAIASTGIIGEMLPMPKILNGINEINKHIHTGAGNFQKAILTTDIVEKHLAVTVEVNGKPVTIGGAAKGSGMIHPNMATMLAFITTDAAVAPEALQNLLREKTDSSFNMITVDGDSSTNDMVLVLANGQSGAETLSPDHPEWHTFASAFTYVAESLAKKIARDGEGATKLVEVAVSGAASKEDARKTGKAVVGSSLVKTAIYGADPNWGRIITAAGYSGAQIDPGRVTIMLGDISVVENGTPASFSEKAASDYLKQDTVRIWINLQQGNEEATAWGCDLSYDYVKINASYRT